MNKHTWYYIALGAGVGAIFGGAWIALGAGIGLVLDTVTHPKKDESDQDGQG